MECRKVAEGINSSVRCGCDYAASPIIREMQLAYNVGGSVLKDSPGHREEARWAFPINECCCECTVRAFGNAR